MESDKKDGDTMNKRELNIILRNVPERKNEAICDTVNAILKDGLRLRDVSVTKAERLYIQNSEKGNKGKDRNTKPGVIVASLRNKDDKRKVTENKKKLNDSRNRHECVFIHSDQSREERLQRSNLKTLILSNRATAIVYNWKDHELSAKTEHRMKTTEAEIRIER